MLQPHVETLTQHLDKLTLGKAISQTELSKKTKDFINTIDDIREKRLTSQYDLKTVNTFYDYINCYYQPLLLIKKLAN